MSRNITRRQFLKQSFASGFTLAVAMTPFGPRIYDAAAAMVATGDTSFNPSVWLTITPNDIVTVIVAKSEMGQGVFTSLPMIVAEELDADWKKVTFESAPAGDKYKDPVWGFQGTGGSTSIRHMYDALRKAGASAREMLVAAAAEQWSVSPADCTTVMSRVRHQASGRSATYGELVLAAAKQTLPENPQLKNESRFIIIGKPAARLDMKEKTDGTARFGTDVFVPDVLYALVARPPAYGARAEAYSKAAAMKVKGVKDVAEIDSGIAVCADSFESAEKGRAALAVRWSAGTAQTLSTKSLEEMFAAALDKKGIVAKSEGDALAAIQRSPKRIESVYSLPYLAHATLEPMNCTVSVQKDRCEIWIPTQNQTGVLGLAVKETGLPAEQVSVHTTYLGGGFGRRFETDVLREALQIAKKTGRPVKLIWTREDDLRNDFYRPGTICRIAAGMDDSGRVTGYHHKVVCPSIFERVFPAMMKNGIDNAAVEGIDDTEYELPAVNVEYVKIDTPVPVGFWRSVGNSHNAFTVECFIDELATVAKKDPLDFRGSLLKNHPRAKRVLDVAAFKANWDSPLPKGRFRGIARHYSFGTHVAHVAEISVDRKSGRIRVHRVVVAVDCGRVINPDTVRAQMEGGTLFGLSAALKEKVEFRNGGVRNENYHDYEILRMDETPQIEVNILSSTEAPGGVGEPGVPSIAPAVANAFFAATGVRLRKLPMTPENILAALRSSHGK